LWFFVCLFHEKTYKKYNFLLSVCLMIVNISCDSSGPKPVQEELYSVISEAKENSTPINEVPLSLSEWVCGNAKIERDASRGYLEQCDDGNNLDGDGCNHLCLWECGGWTSYIKQKSLLVNILVENVLTQEWPSIGKKQLFLLMELY